MLIQRKSRWVGTVLSCATMALTSICSAEDRVPELVAKSVSPDYQVTTIDLAGKNPPTDITFKVGDRTVTLAPGTIGVIVNPPAATAKQVSNAAEPKKLSLGAAAPKTDEQLANMQKLYRKFAEEGRSEDAKQIARWICEDDELTPPLAAQKKFDGDVVPAISMKEPKPFPIHHQVGYRPLKSDNEGDHVVLMGTGESPAWNSIATNKCSFQFSRTSMLDVARYFQLTTGMTVRIELTNGFASVGDMQISATGRDKSIEESLRIALATQGLGYYIRNNELVIVPANSLAVITKQKKVETYWSGIPGAAPPAGN